MYFNLFSIKDEEFDSEIEDNLDISDAATFFASSGKNNVANLDSLFIIDSKGIQNDNKMQIKGKGSEMQMKSTHFGQSLYTNLLKYSGLITYLQLS